MAVFILKYICGEISEEIEMQDISEAAAMILFDKVMDDGTNFKETISEGE